jgi:hypothetical protein
MGLAPGDQEQESENPPRHPGKFGFLAHLLLSLRLACGTGAPAGAPEYRDGIMEDGTACVECMTFITLIT